MSKPDVTLPSTTQTAVVAPTTTVVETALPQATAHRGNARGRSRRGGRGRGSSRGYDRPHPYSSSDHPKAIGSSKPSTRHSMLMTYADKAHFLLYCSNHGIEQLCGIVFSAIQGRDFRSVARITPDYLKYVTSLAYFYRCIRVADLAGYRPGPLQISDLRAAVSGLRLPGVLCDYIESLGVVTLSSGASVGPWIANPVDWYNAPGMFSPEYFLSRIPDGHGYGPWFIDNNVINLWNDSTTRPASRSMSMRTLNFDKLEGSQGLVTSIVWREGDMVEPQVPQVGPNSEAILHGCYQWRLLEEILFWPGDTSMLCAPLFKGTTTSVSQFWSTHVVASFTDPEM